MWNKLSMADRAKYIQLGVSNGITDLSVIKEAYNSYAKGGFIEWKNKIQKHKGVIIDGDDSYDYESYYNDNPTRAWNMLEENSDQHFPDTYKTSKHPTFSDESKYSGTVNKYNPTGLTGGHWIDDQTYVLSNSQMSSGWDTDRTIDYLDKEKIPPTLYAPDGSIMLRSVVVTPQSSALNASRAAKSPNTDFGYAQDMSRTQRFGANYLAGVPLIGTNPHTCLNTVTGFYDPKNTVASNANMVAHPEDYGYKEIPQSEATPGDIIILSNGDNHPTHAVMFDSISEGYGIHNGFNYAPGDTLVNYSNGGRGKNDYRLQGPLPRFDDPDMAGGDFSGVHRYFKYTGKKNKFESGGGLTLGYDDDSLEGITANAAIGLIPIVGTANEARQLWNNPSWEQAGWTALSLMGDVVTIFTLGAGEGVKAGISSLKTTRSLSKAARAYKQGKSSAQAARASKAADKAYKADVVARRGGPSVSRTTNRRRKAADNRLLTGPTYYQRAQKSMKNQETFLNWLNGSSQASQWGIETFSK